ASEAPVAIAGWDGRRDRGAGPAGGRRSRETAGGAALADASRSRSDHRVGHGADAGTGEAVCFRTAGRKLLRADSPRAFQRRTAAVGTDQQARQFVSALFAGG